MAGNEHMMTTRSKKRSRVDESNNSSTINASDTASFQNTAKGTRKSKTRASSNKTNTEIATTSRSTGKKPVYNADPDSDAEDNVTFYKPGTRGRLIYDPDPDSDAEDNITVFEPATTTKLRTSKGKVVERRTSSGFFNGDMLGLAIKDAETASYVQATTSPNTANKHKDAVQKAAGFEKQTTISRTTKDEAPGPKSPLQAPGPRTVHPDYPDLPPEVPVDNKGIRESTIPSHPRFLRV